MNEVIIGCEIKKISHLFRRQLDKSFNVNLTSNQRFVMSFIVESYKAKRDIFQKDIEKELNIRRSTATVMLQTLEKNGFIKRESVSQDARLKRIVPIKIMDKKEFKNKVKEIESLATKSISSKDLELFINVLNKIGNNLGESDNND